MANQPNMSKLSFPVGCKLLYSVSSILLEFFVDKLSKLKLKLKPLSSLSGKVQCIELLAELNRLFSYSWAPIDINPGSTSALFNVYPT